MNTATRRPTRFGKVRRTRKPAELKPFKDRHVMRDADKRNTYPKAPDEKTHPFETTMDF